MVVVRSLEFHFIVSDFFGSDMIKELWANTATRQIVVMALYKYRSLYESP